LRRGRADVELILKPHPRQCEAAPAWLGDWRRLAANEKGVRLLDDPAAPAADALLAADILVSDASSVMLEYLALGRPVVLVTNPERFNDQTHFDSAGYEWAWRDMGEEVHDVELLSEAVGRALDGADNYATARAAYRTHLFGDLDNGKAAERIVGSIAGLAKTA